MKTIIDGQNPLSPGAMAMRAKLEADPVFRRNRELFARLRSGTATESDRQAHAEIVRPFREGRQDVVRG